MDVKDFFNSLTPEQIEEGNKRQLENNVRVYEEFTTAYKIGKCSLCGQLLTEFISFKPCFHWFLRPHGIKKKNLDAPYKNINDLKSEMNPAKLTEYTIRYKNIEWSVNIGKTDSFGHPNSQNANFPHFHIQMKVDNNVFIKFNDFHIPLSDEDIFTFKAMEEAPDKVIWKNTFGEGMSILEDEESLEHLDSLMTRTDDTENATFNTNTLIQMPEGETMNGDLLNTIFKESKESGIPVRHLLKKHFPQASFATEIKPGDGVPEISKRTPRK